MGKRIAAKSIIRLADSFTPRKKSPRGQGAKKVKFQRLQHGMKQFGRYSKRGYSKQGIKSRIDLNKVVFFLESVREDLNALTGGEKKKQKRFEMNLVAILRPIQKCFCS